jgi:peptide/nickel transport system permease protein
MLTYIIRRLIQLLPVLLIVGILTFALVHLTPGDPAIMMLGDEAEAAEIERLRQELGLDQPVPVQFVTWFGDVLRLDFGRSYFLGQSVTEAIWSRAETTGLLTLYAMTISILIGVPAGMIAAVKSGSLIDRALMVFAISGAAIPNFFLGILLIIVFAVMLGWLPAAGYVNITDDPIGHFRAMILPAFATGFSSAGLLARLTRSSMLDVMREDYIRTALAKGLLFRRVVMRHALRNALIPVVTVIGLSLGAALGGAVVTETVFTLPGMGRLVVQSVARRDYPVIQGAVMIIATFYVLANLLVDILYVYIDPRIRYGSE